MLNANLALIIKLIEQGPDMFYDHFSTSTQSNKIEIQWENGIWRYRTIPYQGEWVFIENPLLITGLDFLELEKKAAYFLSIEYYCYKTNLRENPFRLRRIEKVLGTERCNQIIFEMNAFKEGLFFIHG